MQVWEKLRYSKRVVVKIGSSTLSYPNGRLNYQRLVNLAETLAILQKSGKEMILVSSGAIAVGAGRMGMTSRPTDLAGKQALASVGQAELITIYRRFFSARNQQIAQVLLTKDIVLNPERRKNAANTIAGLINNGIIPVINENDTVATDEIEFGDNDTLSAYVSVIANADLLVLLSDIDGLYSSDPKIDPDATIIPVVDIITDELQLSATGAGSGFGTGGMTTKLKAAGICYDAGIKVVITNGASPGILNEILDGRVSGTLFLSEHNKDKYHVNNTIQ